MIRHPALYLGWQLFLRDFHARYRRAAFAILWILSPIAAIVGVSSFVASNLGVAHGPDGLPYPLFAALSLTLWGLFSESLTGPQQMCRRTRNVLKRAPLPPLALLVATLGYVLLNFAVKLLPLAALCVFYGVAPSPHSWLALPFVVALPLLGLALGAVIAPLSMVYLDVRHGLGTFVGGLLLATPVLYHVPEHGLRHLATIMNPIGWLLAPARDLILFGNLAVDFPGDDWIVYGAPLAALGLLLLALAYFRRMLKRGIAQL